MLYLQRHTPKTRVWPEYHKGRLVYIMKEKTQSNLVLKIDCLEAILERLETIKGATEKTMEEVDNIQTTVEALLKNVEE